MPDPDPTSTTEGDQQQVAGGDVQDKGRVDDGPQFDQASLSRAQSAGFTQDEINAIGADNLSMVMRAADRMAATGIPGQQQADVGTGQPPGQVDPMQFAANLELNKDDVDEHVINALNGINKHYATQSVQFMAAIGELLNRFGAVNDTVGRMTFDQHVSGLGEDWHPVLGPPNGRNVNELEKLRNQVDLMQQLATAQGQPMSYGDAFQRALGSLYFPQLAQMERTKLNARVQQGMQRTSERPRSREEEPAQDGEEKAADRVRKAQAAALGGA